MTNSQSQPGYHDLPLMIYKDYVPALQTIYPLQMAVHPADITPHIPLPLPVTPHLVLDTSNTTGSQF